MDASGMYDDEVVADSEDEGAGMELMVNDGPMKALAHIPSMIKTSLDSIVSAESTASTSYPNYPKPRPKPRPIKKAAATSSSSISPFTAQAIATPSSEIYMDTSSNIADRAKMRARNIKPVTPVDIIELSSDDEFNLSKPRQKAKAKSKTTTKSKSSARTNSELDDISTPDPHSRPRPKPIPKKRTKTSHPTSPLGASTPQSSNPIPTSSIPDDPLPIPFRLIPSQLPPSDPPESTSTTYDLPPIETLPNLETDIDVPFSSPSSLFDVHSSGKRKRRRAMSRVDELDSEMDHDSRMMPPPALPGPPPTFFAGSSSPPTDISMNHPPIAVAETGKKPAPKKPRKKKQDAEDDEGGDGAEWGTKKPKAKSKPKKSPQNKVEVVIEQKLARKAKAKGKGMDKEKEVFKSREFIDDDEEEEDEMLGNLRNTTSTSKKSTKPDSMTSLSSLPETDTEEPKSVGSSKKRKSTVLHVENKAGETAVGKGKRKKRAVISDDEDDYAGNTDEPPPRSEPSSKSKGKRKKVVVSEDEDDEAAAGEPSRKVSSVKSSAKGKDSGKNNGRKGAPDADDGVEDNAMSGQAGDMDAVATLKENVQPTAASHLQTPNPKPASKHPETLFPSLSSRYTIAPKTKSTPMSELIRRVNSLPGSPFVSPAPRASGSTTRLSTPGTAYSPYLKSSRSALSRIAPLHPNRRTPPPPLPPPPPRPKTKKEREREEQWEEELVESVGGITEWACMTDAERKELRRAKREREMAGWED